MWDCGTSSIQPIASFAFLAIPAMEESGHEGLFQYCRDCKVKGPHRVVTCLLDCGITNLDELRSPRRVEMEDQGIKKYLQKDPHVKAEDLRKVMAGLEALRRPINDKFLKFKTEFSRAPFVVKRQCTFETIDDATVEQPRKIIHEILTLHGQSCLDDMTGIDDGEVFHCKRRLEVWFKSWLREQNSQFHLSDNEESLEKDLQLYQNIQEFFTWLGINDNGEIKHFDFCRLGEFDRRLQAFPKVRQCFHKLWNHDISGIEPLLEHFPDFIDEAWLPGREEKTLLCAAIEAEEVEAVQLLIAKGASVDHALLREATPTPLHLAVQVSKDSSEPDKIRQIVRLLLQVDADVEALSHPENETDPEVWQMVQQHREERFPSMRWENAPIHPRLAEREWTEVDKDISQALTAAFHKKILLVELPAFQARFQDCVITYSSGEHFLFRRKELGEVVGPIRWLIAENLPGARWEGVDPVLQPALERRLRDHDVPCLILVLVVLLGLLVSCSFNMSVFVAIFERSCSIEMVGCEFQVATFATFGLLNNV